MWSPTSLCYDPVISKVFSRNKFEIFLTFLHLVDAATEKVLADEGDKLAKVRPLLNYVQSKCRELYQPNREINIDERMVRSKARFSFRQYIRNKPVKWGFKLWCLCDSHNGYTSSFSVYRGKNGEVRSSNGLGYDVVLNLMKPYLSQGYSLYVDNFYTSPILVSDLYSQGVHVTGTIGSGRIGVPPEVGDLKQVYSKASACRGDGAYVRDGIKVFSVWKDTKCVCVLSSEHPGHSSISVERNVKDKGGKSQKKDVPIPIIVYNYNKYMNGVDRSDQLIKYYNILRQTKKYWKTLFFHFIDIAIINSFILFKEKFKTSGKCISQFVFGEAIVRELCDVQLTIRQSVAGRKPVSLHDHRSVRMVKPADCVYCRIIDSRRTRTTRCCSMCKAPLCFLARTCFQKFHHQHFKTLREQWLRKCATGLPLQSLDDQKEVQLLKGEAKERRRTGKITLHFAENILPNKLFNTIVNICVTNL